MTVSYRWPAYRWVVSLLPAFFLEYEPPLTIPFGTRESIPYWAAGGGAVLTRESKTINPNMRVW